MTTTFKRIIITGIALIAIAAAACAAVLSGGCSATEQDPLAPAKNGIVNAALDISGVKGRIDSEARERAGEIAARAGISKDAAENMVDALAIPDWKACSLPADAEETGTYDVDAGDVSAKVTTYDDPGVVTVSAYGQTITMEVPVSARSYVPLLRYLEYLG